MFENDSAKIFCYLKANINTDVTTEIIQHKFRGLKTKARNFVKKLVGKKIITYCLNKITEERSLRMMLSSLGTLLSILSHIVDIVKDSILALSLLSIIGGAVAILEFPTNFSSTVVLCWMGTIIVPILVSSLYLALTQPFLVFTSTRLRAMRGGRVLAALGCLLLSPFNIVVLKTNLEMTEQTAIEAARDLSGNTLDLFQECDLIEAKIQEYLQIEQGQ